MSHSSKYVIQTGLIHFCIRIYSRPLSMSKNDCESCLIGYILTQFVLNGSEIDTYF